MTITLLAHKIEWETDGDVCQLPAEMSVEVELLNIESFACINQQVCDQLTDKTGYLVSGYELKGFQ
jgi:hypothetical protein